MPDGLATNAAAGSAPERHSAGVSLTSSRSSWSSARMVEYDGVATENARSMTLPMSVPMRHFWRW